MATKRHILGSKSIPITSSWYRTTRNSSNDVISNSAHFKQPLFYSPGDGKSSFGPTNRSNTNKRFTNSRCEESAKLVLQYSQTRKVWMEDLSKSAHYDLSMHPLYPPCGFRPSTWKLELSNLETAGQKKSRFLSYIISGMRFYCAKKPRDTHTLKPLQLHNIDERLRFVADSPNLIGQDVINENQSLFSVFHCRLLRYSNDKNGRESHSKALAQLGAVS